MGWEHFIAEPIVVSCFVVELRTEVISKLHYLHSSAVLEYSAEVLTEKGFPSVAARDNNKVVAVVRLNLVAHFSGILKVRRSGYCSVVNPTENLAQVSSVNH
jgi:hypothetical protein